MRNALVKANFTLPVGYVIDHVSPAVATESKLPPEPGYPTKSVTTTTFRGVSLHLHVYIHLCTYTLYTYILEAYTVYCTGHMLSKQRNEESFL